MPVVICNRRKEKGVMGPDVEIKIPNQLMSML